MLGTSALVAFAATLDAPRARAFYQDVLGLTLVEHNDFASVFDANGTMLRVTPVPTFTPAPDTVLGWAVAEISTTVRDLTAKGVTFTRYPGMDQDETRVWTAPGGARIAWFTDPDGNVLSLTQFG
ncbi:MAG TPA: VOC family protein [Pseudonocardiaceae bacterium]|jgi:catechol 2,3-dioxygenase-like lactoylglutathione lyase family enzyme|nr:VOC family protein [Pseudonocardiaceae bacterium]